GRDRRSDAQGPRRQALCSRHDDVHDLSGEELALNNEEVGVAPKVGYLLPTREGVMQGKPAAAPLLALAERAEALGYDSLWIGDSLIDRPRHEPLVMLAGVAARTKRMVLGTGVLLPALRNPVQLAHQVATLDQISEGRLILGIGIGPDSPGIHAEFTAA